MALDPLPEISRFESGNQNIPNYEYSPEHTASGPWQINVSTWNDQVAPNTGLPPVSYPAGVMSLPVSEQEQGAAYLYNTEGFSPWEPYNPQLAADIQAQGGESAFTAPGSYTPSDSTGDGGVSLSAQEAPMSDFTGSSTPTSTTTPATTSSGGTLSSLWEDVVNFFERFAVGFFGMILAAIAVWFLISETKAGRHVKDAALAAVAG